MNAQLSFDFMGAGGDVTTAWKFAIETTDEKQKSIVILFTLDDSRVLRGTAQEVRLCKQFEYTLWLRNFKDSFLHHNPINIFVISVIAS